MKEHHHFIFYNPVTCRTKELQEEGSDDLVETVKDIIARGNPQGVTDHTPIPDLAYSESGKTDDIWMLYEVIYVDIVTEDSLGQVDTSFPEFSVYDLFS